MHIYFSDFGTFINGFASESVMNCQKKINHPTKLNSLCRLFTFGSNETQTHLPLWDGLTTNLPVYFHEFLLNDPLHSIGSTFCIWNINHKDTWRIGDIAFPEDGYSDGSEELMVLLDGSPKTYLTWASEYYDLHEFDLYYLEYIYDHRIIDYAIVRAINPEFTHWYQLKKELDWIGYPNEL
ncbi:hypothetical protein NBRC110019_16410 [Neptunitalea chrysea]|uniref:Uncharacterized protein n=1 Tax=Neptunitalea chrysea TaxID=1647581 RepID=A0A9W6B4X0_9FLAO|nr:hypothetical protein [Neptunitalea chrysea]GLB52601.1 hypothetical protein NBRC110019_16410 [Neptunitalea chrysea]